jgi:hypothetical protein
MEKKGEDSDHDEREDSQGGALLRAKKFLASKTAGSKVGFQTRRLSPLRAARRAAKRAAGRCVRATR